MRHVRQSHDWIWNLIERRHGWAKPRSQHKKLFLRAHTAPVCFPLKQLHPFEASRAAARSGSRFNLQPNTDSCSGARKLTRGDRFQSKETSVPVYTLILWRCTIRRTHNTPSAMNALIFRAACLLKEVIKVTQTEVNKDRFIKDLPL